MEMDAVDRKIIGTDIRTVEMGWPIGCRFAGALFRRAPQWSINEANGRRTLGSAQQYHRRHCSRPMLRPPRQNGFAALAALNPGEVVLDLGSGGGIDVLLSAKRVGPTGNA